jgi:hypothetical protein
MARNLDTRSRPRANDDIVRSFFAAYISNGGNASAALETVIPNPARGKQATWRYASVLKRHPEFVRLQADQEARAALSVAHALERYGITAEQAAEEMARLAFTELRQVVDWYTITDKKTGTRRQVVRVKDASEIDPDAHRALTKITTRADGSVTIELADKRAAIMDLARLKGWIQDKPQDNTQAVSLIIQR